MDRSSKELLRNRQFQFLFTARSAVFLGNALGVLGLSFGVLRLPHGTGSELGIILFVRSTAQILLMLLGGVLGDRYPKKFIMMASDLLAGVSQLGIGLMVVGGLNNMAALAALSAVNGGATGAFLPVSTGVLPEVVDREHLQPANAILRVMINIGNFTGSSLAAVLVTLAGPGPALVANAFMYFLSVACLSRLRGARKQNREQSQASMTRDLIEGWRTFAGQRWIWTIVVQAAIINAVYRGATQVLGPVVADRLPHGAGLWSLALAAQTVGLFVGSALGFTVRARYPLRIAALCISLLAAPVAVLALRVSLLWMLPAMFIAGLATDLFTVLWESALQKRVRPELLSRVSSYDALGSFALAPLGLVAAGFVASAPSGLTLGASAAIVVAVGLAVLAVPDVRNMKDTEPPRATDAEAAAPPAPADPANPSRSASLLAVELGRRQGHRHSPPVTAAVVPVMKALSSLA